MLDKLKDWRDPNRITLERITTIGRRRKLIRMHDREGNSVGYVRVTRGFGKTWYEAYDVDGNRFLRSHDKAIIRAAIDADRSTLVRLAKIRRLENNLPDRQRTR